MNKEIKHYKVKQLPSRPLADSVYWVKASPSSEVSGYITDLQGVPYPLKDISGSGGIQTITNTDGNISIVGSNNIVINISPTLLSVINSALQSGDNISELTNDVGYITSFVETDPIFQASEASLFVAGDKVNLDNQSGVNSGDETTLSIKTKRPLKTINNESLEGSGNIQIDYNDLDNKPPTFPPSSIISKFIFNEIPSGIIDGINSIFNTNFLLVPDTEVVFINGQKQKKPDDYNISGQTITFTFSPGVSESVAINYIKQ